MPYVLQRVDDGFYVAPSGGVSSYCRDILKARRFDSRETAQSDACGNERVIDLSNAVFRD